MVFAIRATRLFDGWGPALVEHPVVVVDGSRIVEVRRDGTAPEAVDVVDLGTATLLPGLIDCHVHLVFDASADPVGRLAAATERELLDDMRAAAGTALRAGVTTVRDLGDRDYLTLRLREEFADAPTLGPRILAAGPPITTPRGHCWFLGGEAEGVEGVRDAVRRHAERGVDVVKVMATGGEMTPGTHSHVPQYTVDELRAAVDEAHRYGLPITAHAHGGAGIANVAAAGFDSVEHCSFLTESGARAEPEVIDALVRAGVAVSATMGYRPGAALPPRIAARLAALAEVFRQVATSGVTFACGTDAGIGPAKPHDVLPAAVVEMVTVLGLPPVAALRAVTSTAARVCRVGERAGRIKPGYDADLLAVTGDPLADPGALRNVAAVFRAGRRVR